MKLISIFLFVFVLALPSCVFFGKSKEELYDQALKNKPYDVIIVPGIPFDSSTDDYERTLKGRIYWAKHLYTSGITKNIIFSGGAVYTPYVEGIFMAELACQIGIPRANVFSETKAEHSTENIYYSYYLAKRMGFNKIAVATDPFQAKMLGSYPKKMKVSMDFIPFVIDSLAVMEKKEFDYSKLSNAYVTNFVSLPDRQSRFKRLLGTMGKNIQRDDVDPKRKRKDSLK